MQNKNMENEMYNEKELKALEAEIRAMGIPYSANEPDERYFANFRVHLMERIEAKEVKQGFFAAAFSWFTPLRSLSLGATLAGVIVAVMLMRPSSEPTVAVVAPAVTPIQTVTPQPENPQPVARRGGQSAEVPKPAIKATVQKQIVAEPKNTNVAQTVKPSATEVAVNAAADFASMDEELTTDDTDAPIDYTKLSESELESVIAVAQEMN